jgi:RimJ/RimL family protein N-acetyltransferase
MLRLATVEDFEAMKPLVYALKDDYKFTPLYRDFVFTEEVLRHYTANPKERCTVLAIENEEVVGFCTFEVQGNYARFVYVYLKPEFRDKGYMEQFLDAFEYWGSGCKFYYMGVSDDNVDLTKRGYQKCEIVYMKEIN